MNLEKTYVCSCIWRKEINYLGATRVDGMKLAEGIRVGLICGSKTFGTAKKMLGDDSKTTLGMPF